MNDRAMNNKALRAHTRISAIQVSLIIIIIIIIIIIMIIIMKGADKWIYG
jgi:hypothetical protein